MNQGPDDGHGGAPIPGFLGGEQCRMLDAMGVDVWLARRPKTGQDQTGVDEPSMTESTLSPSEMDWPELEAAVAACKQCSLHHKRTQTVFGAGDPLAQWMIIGEAPGADEDRQGQPFVGKAGQLLNEMLHAVGLSRDQVYIANILKCRPPANRDPGADEVASCMQFLRRQIALVNPKLILAVGRIAAQNLLDEDQPVGRLRGRVHNFGEQQVPVVVTYHPAYLLRSPGQKRKAWEDLCLARSIAGRSMT